MRPDSLPKIPARVPTAERNSQVRTGRVSSREVDCSLSPAIALTAIKRRLATMRYNFMKAVATVSRLGFVEHDGMAIAGRDGACRRLQTAIRLSIKGSGRF